MLAGAKQDPIILGAPQKVVALVNPISGNGRGKRVLDLLQNGDWQVEVKTFLTEAGSMAGHQAALEFAQKIGADRLIVSGGDGTLMETLTTMLNGDFSFPISLVPTGTGNIVASDLSIPRRLVPAIKQAFSGGVLRQWDAGHLQNTDQMFVLRASAGHDAMALSETHSHAKKRIGQWAYILPAFRALRRINPVTFTLTIDDQAPFDIVGITAFVAVTNRISGRLNMVLSHDIQPDDGKLHVGVIHARKLLFNLPSMLNQGSLNARNNVVTFPVENQVRIDASEALPMQIDGELLDDSMPLIAHTRPAAVDFVTPLQ